MKKGPDYESTYSQSITIGLTPKMMKMLDKASRKEGCSRNQIVRMALLEYLKGE